MRIWFEPWLSVEELASAAALGLSFELLGLEGQHAALDIEAFLHSLHVLQIGLCLIF